MYRYYVYGHYTNDGTLFYIGKGSGDRINSVNRNSAHDRIASKKGCVSKVLIEGLLETEALALEKDFIWYAEDIGFILTNQNLGNYSQPTLTDEEALSFISFIHNRNKFNDDYLEYNNKESIKIDLDAEIINREYEKTIYNILENYTQLQIDLLSIIFVNYITYSLSNTIKFSTKELSEFLNVEEELLKRELIVFYPNLDLEVKTAKKYSRYPVVKNINLHDDCYEFILFHYYQDLFIKLYNEIYKYSSEELDDYLASIVHIYNEQIEINNKINSPV